MSYRNFVLSGVLKRLAQDFDLRVVSGPGQEALATAAQSQDWESYAIPAQKLADPLRAKLLGLAETAQYLRYYELYPNSTMRKYVRELQKKRDIRSQAVRATLALSRLAAAPGEFVKGPYLFLARSRVSQLLESVDGVLLLSTDLLWDKTLGVAARRRGLPITSVVHSWDNLPARGFLAEKPDRLLVWNQEMSEQAAALHQVPRDRTRVVGVPQYDLYRHLAGYLDRGQFLKEKGISGRFITYTCSAERVVPDELQLVSFLHELARKNGRSLVIRAHPVERREIYKRFVAEHPGTVLSLPSATFSASEKVQCLDDVSALKEFVGLMRFSDAIINLASTITLDASLFGTPVLCPRFNLDPAIEGQWNAAARWYESEHFGPIARSGAVRIADSPEHFETLLAEVLSGSHPGSTVAQAQARLMSQFAPYPGESAERITQAVRELFP